MAKYARIAPARIAHVKDASRRVRPAMELAQGVNVVKIARIAPARIVYVKDARR